MRDKIEIPLFPLSVVLFPSSKLPLFIFEDRYKKMINKCVNENSEFGVNFFSDRKIYSSGCTAIVDQVISSNSNDEMNIIVKGIRRYVIIKYEPGPEGYYKGEVELTEDVNNNYEKEKMENAVLIYNNLVDIVYRGKVKKIDLNDIKWKDNKRSVVFTMAEKSGLSLNERQNLLETDDEDKRLDFILKYFDEVMPKIKEADKVSSIIKGDGYIQQ